MKQHIIHVIKLKKYINLEFVNRIDVKDYGLILIFKDGHRTILSKSIFTRDDFSKTVEVINDVFVNGGQIREV